MVFHGPDVQTFRERLRLKELDLFMCDRYLVTIHEDPIKSIEEAAERARTDANVVLEAGADLLLHRIVDGMVDQYQPILDYLGESLDDLEERALVSNQLNQIMKTLTIISVIALPFTIVTSFFGMNFESIPGLRSKLGFWSAVGFMGCAVAVMQYWFRRKRWI